MLDPFAMAQRAIRAAFADPEPLDYTQDGLHLPPFQAIRSDRAAPTFEGPGATLRTITYEIEKRALPAVPTKKDSFTHRGRKWSIQDVTSLEDVAAWHLIVTDAGAA